jgi:hypothetical protein
LICACDAVGADTATPAISTVNRRRLEQRDDKYISIFLTGD